MVGTFPPAFLSVSRPSAFPATPKRLQSLTGLRFVAASLIVLEHSAGRFGLPADLGHPFLFDQAVSFFFILSGFILTYVYPSLDGIGTRRFLLARVARLWPAHLAAFALLFLVLPAAATGRQDGHTLGIAVLNLLLIHGWIPLKQVFYSFNVVSWSISTELGFSLFFPLLIHHWQRTWWWKLTLTLGLVIGLVTLINITHLPANSGMGTTGLLYINPLGRLFEFTLGMTTALLWRRLVPQIQVSLAGGTLLEGLAIFSVAACMYCSSTWAHALATQAWIGTAGVFWLAQIGFTCLSFAALVLVMACDTGLVSRFLGLPLPVLLGEISFSVYLIHDILISYYTVHFRAFLRVPNWLIYSLFWIITLLMAHMIWRAVECPCRAFIMRLGKGQSAPPMRVRQGRSSLPARSGIGELFLLLCLVVPMVGISRGTPKADQGHLDGVSCTLVTGWAWDEHQPNIPVMIDLFDATQHLATVRADRPRPDLGGGGFGNGQHGFVYVMSNPLKNNQSHTIHAEIVGTTIALNGSPRVITCPP